MRDIDTGSSHYVGFSYWQKVFCQYKVFFYLGRYMEIVLHKETDTQLKSTYVDPQLQKLVNGIKKLRSFDHIWNACRTQVFTCLGLQDQSEIESKPEENSAELVRQCVEWHEKYLFEGKPNNLTLWSNLHFYLEYMKKKLTREEVKPLLQNWMLIEHYGEPKTFGEVYRAIDWSFFHAVTNNIDRKDVVQYFPREEVFTFVEDLIVGAYEWEYWKGYDREWNSLWDIYCLLHQFLKVSELYQEEPYDRWYRFTLSFNRIRREGSIPEKDFVEEAGRYIFWDQKMDQLISKKDAIEPVDIWLLSPLLELDKIDLMNDDMTACLLWSGANKKSHHDSSSIRVSLSPQWEDLEKMIDIYLENSFDKLLSVGFSNLLEKTMRNVGLYKMLFLKHVKHDSNDISLLCRQLENNFEELKKECKRSLYIGNSLSIETQTKTNVTLSKKQSIHVLETLNAIHKVTDIIEKTILSPLKKKVSWLYAIGWKIHFPDSIDQAKLEEFINRYRFWVTWFKMIHAWSSMLLPPVYSAQELILLIQALSEEWLFTDDCDLQVSVAWRLPNEDAAILGSATLLCTERCNQYTMDSFCTTHDELTWARIMAYDAWVLDSRFDYNPDTFVWRTDMMWLKHFGDIKNYQLVWSLLSQTHYGGRFATLGKQFREEYLNILEKYWMRWIVDRQWIYDAKQDTLEDQIEHYQLIKNITDRRQYDIDLVVETLSEDNILSYDIKNLLQKYRNKILSTNHLSYNEKENVWTS